MFGSLISAAVLFATLVAGVGGYLVTRNFVRRRLRFVDAIQSPLAPVAAGVLAFLVCWPLTLLPVVTLTTAVALGFGCAFGTASGVRALRRGPFTEGRLLR
jgi:uncharacterized membrane protein